MDNKINAQIAIEFHFINPLLFIFAGNNKQF